MKAVVFAAGVGSRLKPFTDFHPKALAEISGKPILGHVLDKLIAAGADDIVVNVHHFSEQVFEYLRINYPSVKVSDESALLLDTAGGLAKIYREDIFSSPVKSDEPVLVHNADIYTDFPMAEMMMAFREGSAVVLVDNARKSSRELLFNTSGLMVGWHNIKSDVWRPTRIDLGGVTGAAFGGVHILSGNIIERLNEYVGAELRPCGIMDFYIDSCRDMKIRAFTPSKAYKWFDIGTSEKLEAARKAIEN